MSVEQIKWDKICNEVKNVGLEVLKKIKYEQC